METEKDNSCKAEGGTSNLANGNQCDTEEHKVLLPLVDGDSGISLASRCEESDAVTSNSLSQQNDNQNGVELEDVDVEMCPSQEPAKNKAHSHRTLKKDDKTDHEQNDDAESFVSCEEQEIEVMSVDVEHELKVENNDDEGGVLSLDTAVEAASAMRPNSPPRPQLGMVLGAAGSDEGREASNGGLAVDSSDSEDHPNLSNGSHSENSDSSESMEGVVNPDLLTPNQRVALRMRSFRRQQQERQRRQNRVRLRDNSGSDSDSSDTDIEEEDNVTDEDVGGKSSGRESEREEEIQRAVRDVMGKPYPLPNWYALPELRRREYGQGMGLTENNFRCRVQGSLQMVRRLTIEKRMTAHEGCVNALSFNRIGTLLASGSDDLNIVLWNWQRARPSATYDSGHRSNVFQAKMMPFSGDCHIISCARDGQVRLAELDSTGVCKATRKLAQHRGAAHKLALEHDSPHVFLSCGEDALTFMFDLRQERPHRLVTAKENEKKVALYSIHSNPSDSNQFCVGGRDHYIRVFDKRRIAEHLNGGVLKKFCPDHLTTSDFKANVTCACYNFNGTEILGTYNDEDIYLFDNSMSDGANYIHRYTGHRNNATVKGVNFYGPRSEFIVSGSDCGNVFFWDKKTEAIVNFQEGDDTGVINVLEPHPTLPILATSGLDYDVKLWTPGMAEPNINPDLLKKIIKKNRVARNLDRTTPDPEIGGQMLWFIMHHFRNSARRRMREEGQVLSSSDEDIESPSDEDDEQNNMQCAQS